MDSVKCIPLSSTDLFAHPKSYCQPVAFFSVVVPSSAVYYFTTSYNERLQSWQINNRINDFVNLSNVQFINLNGQLSPVMVEMFSQYQLVYLSLHRGKISELIMRQAEICQLFCFEILVTTHQLYKHMVLIQLF